jgi:hypothetical protein
MSAIFLLDPQNEVYLRGERRKQPFKMPLLIVLAALLVAIPLFVPFLLMSSALQDKALYEHIQQAGVLTEGKIVSHRTYQGRGTRFYLSYSFTIGGEGSPSTAYIHEEEVSQGLYQITDGATVSLRYLPDKPEISRLVENGDDQIRLTLIVSGIFIILGIGMFLWMMRPILNNSRLERKGGVIEGEITEVQKRFSRNRQWYRIQYRFRSPSGSELAGTQDAEMQQDLPLNYQPQTGTKMAVLYYSDKLFHAL